MLLEQAGWIVKDGKRVNKATGEPFRFEILLDNPLFERIALPFIQNLKRLGIDAIAAHGRRRPIYQRTQTFDYDMVVGVFGESLSPGNEQRWFWGSAAADQPGSPNLHRHQESCHRHPDRAGHLRARSRPAHHPRPRPRPGAALELLRHSRISTMGGRPPGLLGHLRPAKGPAAL